MSKLGKRAIIIPSGVSVKLEGQTLTVEGPQGKLSIVVHPAVLVAIADNIIRVSVKNSKIAAERALWGTMWSLINNIVEGVSKGYEKKLDVVGVGYRVAADKQKITLTVGYSHPVELAIPAGLDVSVEKSKISVKGPDKQLVGEFAALIRDQRRPEPYKGKGIKYSDEVVRRKAGKVMKAVGG